jgi:8-oxo-dGTP diphosphatase
MLTKNKPTDFNKRFDIVGCFVEHGGKFLLLHRHSHKASGDKWGLPAGKADEGENIKEAVLREIIEETGLSFSDTDLKYFDSFYVRDGSFDIEWHMFATQIEYLPEVKINPNEHKDYKWVTPLEAIEMNLIHDLKESIEIFYKS